MFDQGQSFDFVFFFHYDPTSSILHSPSDKQTGNQTDGQTDENSGHENNTSIAGSSYNMEA